MQNFNGDFEELARLMDSSSLLAEKNLSVFIFNVNCKMAIFCSSSTWRERIRTICGGSFFRPITLEIIGDAADQQNRNPDCLINRRGEWSRGSVRTYQMPLLASICLVRTTGSVVSSEFTRRLSLQIEFVSTAFASK